MPTIDEHIAQRLRESQRSGELARARSYGKPLAFGDGYFETPEELRLGYKILKDAGYVPAEVDALIEALQLMANVKVERLSPDHVMIVAADAG